MIYWHNISTEKLLVWTDRKVHVLWSYIFWNCSSPPLAARKLFWKAESFLFTFFASCCFLNTFQSFRLKSIFNEVVHSILFTWWQWSHEIFSIVTSGYLKWIIYKFKYQYIIHVIFSLIKKKCCLQNFL